MTERPQRVIGMLGAMAAMAAVAAVPAAPQANADLDKKQKKIKPSMLKTAFRPGKGARHFEHKKSGLRLGLVEKAAEKRRRKGGHYRG